MEKYRELVNGNIPPWVFRFLKSCGRTINSFDMIRADETVLVAVSGGKDSLVAALALALRLKWLPVKYTVKAVLIDWMQEAASADDRKRLEDFFDCLGVEFSILEENKYPDSFRGDFNCYLCSRNRRRILFELCDREGVYLLATGHHLDDIVETSLMNIAFRGHFESMNPVQSFFDGKINVIRPLANIYERTIDRIASSYDLPVVKTLCPFDRQNIRSSVKPIVARLSAIDKLAREHIFSSHCFKDKPVRPVREAETK